MSYYALTDSDWPWDDDDEGRAIVVHANTPQDAVRIATEKHIAENPGAGGIDWKVARLWNVGFEGVDWENDNKPNYDGFQFYPDGCNGPLDAPPAPHLRGSELTIIRLPWHKEPNGDFWRAEVIGRVYEVHDDEMADYKKRQCQYDFEARIRSVLTPPAPQVTGATYSQAEYDEAYEIGKRDGYSEAVQQIDQLTGGDGEYRYCLGDEGSARHTPGPSEMIQRIIDRFETLNLLDEATKSGRDQEWGNTAPAPHVAVPVLGEVPDDCLPTAEDVRGLLAATVPAPNLAALLEKAIEALRPLSDAVFNDNGDMSVSQPLPTYDECVKAYFVVKQIRIALEAPPPAPRAVGSEASHDLSQNHLKRRCVEIADQVVPSYRGKGLCCTGPTAKRWQAAYDGAARALGLEDEEQA